jgi:hypothetical protein
MVRRLGGTGAHFRALNSRLLCSGGIHLGLTARKGGANFGRLDIPCGAGTGWLGRKGSNLRMLESKSSALPLGDAPKLWSGRDHIEGVTGFQRGENAERHPSNARKCLRFWLVAAPKGHRYKGAPARQAVKAVRHNRRVAQPGRALRSGRRGRRFESSLSDHLFRQKGVPGLVHPGVRREYRGRLRPLETSRWESPG